MRKEFITVNVQMDAKTFKRFALFDTFTLRRRWVSPLAFMSILLVFSATAFMLTERAQQASLIGWLLLVLGIGLPFAYFLHYYLQLGAQVRRLNIKKPRPAYFVTFSDDQIRIVNNMAKEQPLLLSYADVHAVWFRKDVLYLYQTENRAFILPAKDASVPLNSLWDFLSTHLPSEKLHK